MFRADACPGSAALPAIGEPAGDPARKGTAIHDFLENCVKKNRDEALRLVPQEFYDACEVIDITALPAGNPESWRVEVAFAYDWRAGTARILGEGMGRNYGELGPNEIPGAVDVAGVTADASVIYDYKTGRAAQEPPEAHWQLKFLGLASATAYGKDEAHVGLIRIWDSITHFEVGHFDALDLANVRHQIVDIMERVEDAMATVARGALPELNVGGHCTYCPAFRICPAMTAHMQMAFDGPGNLIFRPAEVTPEQLGQAYLRLKLIAKATEQMTTDIRELAKSMPVPLGNGKMLAAVQTPREDPIADIAARAIAELYGPEAGREVVKTTVSVTKDRIEEVVRKYMTPGAPIGKTVEAAYQAVRDAGGMSSRFTYPVKEITPKSARALEDGSLSREFAPWE